MLIKSTNHNATKAFCHIEQSAVCQQTFAVLSCRYLFLNETSSISTKIN